MWWRSYGASFGSDGIEILGVGGFGGGGYGVAGDIAMLLAAAAGPAVAWEGTLAAGRT